MGEGRALGRPGPSFHHKQGRFADQDGSGHLISTRKPRREPKEAYEDTPANLRVQHKPLRCLGLARKADTKATGPESTVCARELCLFSECTHPSTPSKVMLTLGTTSLSKPVWLERSRPTIGGTSYWIW